MGDNERVQLIKEDEGEERREEVIEYGKMDSKFSWITCAINFWLTYCTFGIMYTNGIILQYIADELGEKIGTVSIAFSITTAFMFLVCFFFFLPVIYYYSY